MATRFIKKYRRLFVIFLLGMCVGSALFLLSYGRKIDGLLHERNAIYYANNQKNIEIMKLKKKLERYGMKRPITSEDEEIVEKIIVEITNQDIIGVETIKESLEKILQPFSDKQMKWLYTNPDVVALAIEKKQISIDKDQMVQVELKYLSFYKQAMKVWVQVKAMEP